MKLIHLSATELVQLFARKKVSPVEVCLATLDKIEAINPKLNAYQHLDAETALLSARASEVRWMKGAPQGPVDGVPCTIKDNLLAAGWPTRHGSLTVDATVGWNEDCPSVARLRESGAVLLGMTTMPEFAWKVMTDAPLFGITRNPWDFDRTPGGSSGGAAAATASGMCTMAIGTDGGGSIRVPASRCGLVGLKPTHGCVSEYPHSPFGTIASAGPITRTVADCALLMDVIGQPDIRDWYALPKRAGSYGDGLFAGVSGLRIGFILNLGSRVELDTETDELTRDAIASFADLGAIVEQVDLDPKISQGAFGAYRVIRSVLHGEMIRNVPAAQKARMDPMLVHSAESNDELFDLAEYLHAEQQRREIGSEMNQLFGRYDLIVTPTIHSLPERVDEAPPIPWFTSLFNMTRQPALSIPSGLSREGLPVGIQLVGAHYSENLLLQAAAAFEAARPFPALPID